MSGKAFFVALAPVLTRFNPKTPCEEVPGGTEQSAVALAVRRVSVDAGVRRVLRGTAYVYLAVFAVPAWRPRCAVAEPRLAGSRGRLAVSLLEGTVAVMLSPSGSAAFLLVFDASVLEPDLDLFFG